MPRDRKGDSRNSTVTTYAKDANGIYYKPEPKAPAVPFKLEDYLFDKQLKFVTDPRPFKTAVCSRRAGKTIGCAADLIDTALKTPGANSLYITLSRNNAKKLIWPEILKINREFQLGGVADSTELSMRFPNEAMVYLSGAKDESEIEKFRGLALKKAYIDECQSFRPYIQELINDIISPALMDYAGSLSLIGTPGPIPAGFFYDCTQNHDAWAQHHWTFFDNPFITKKSGKTHMELLQRELHRRGVSIEDPSIQREFFGKWVLDSDSLILRYNALINHYDTLPQGNWTYILGIDLGFDDADALAVLAWNQYSPTTYLVEELVVDKQGITELVKQIQDLQQRYNITKMVIDQGGLGKKIAEEIRRRHGIPVHPADKTRKMENLELLNDALRTGRFKAKFDSHFAHDTMLVEKDRAKSTPDRIRISDKYHSDIIDAVLYSFRESPAYSYEEPERLPTPGTPEADRKIDLAMFEAEMEGHLEEQARERYLNGESE